jgi:hypothetical protein
MLTPNSLELLFDVFHTTLLRGHLIAASPSRIPGSDYRRAAREIDDRLMCQKIFGEPVREAYSSVCKSES